LEIWEWNEEEQV